MDPLYPPVWMRIAQQMICTLHSGYVVKPHYCIGKKFQCSGKRVPCSRLIKCSVKKNFPLQQQMLVPGTKSDHYTAVYRIYNFEFQCPKTGKIQTKQTQTGAYKGSIDRKKITVGQSDCHTTQYKNPMQQGLYKSASIPQFCAQARPFTIIEASRHFCTSLAGLIILYTAYDFCTFAVNGI